MSPIQPASEQPVSAEAQATASATTATILRAATIVGPPSSFSEGNADEEALRHRVKKGTDLLGADKVARPERASSYDKPKRMFIHSTG
ncbi:hypothetical protein GCM10023083_13520 [Streptomyces phyllanthi]